MFQFSEALAIGLHAIAYIKDSQGKRVLIKDMAREMGVSAHHLSKVVNRLVKAGILESARGRNGGITLSKDSGDKRILEIYEAIEGSIVPRVCLFKNPVCRTGSCILGDLLKDSVAMFMGYLSNTRISDLPGIFKVE